MNTLVFACAETGIGSCPEMLSWGSEIPITLTVAKCRRPCLLFHKQQWNLDPVLLYKNRVCLEKESKKIWCRLIIDFQMLRYVQSLMHRVDQLTLEPRIIPF